MDHEIRQAARIAVEKAGGPRAMAESLVRLTQRKYSAGDVRKWYIHGVPSRYVLWVEYLTGVPVERLRPDMSPKAVR